MIESLLHRYAENPFEDVVARDELLVPNVLVTRRSVVGAPGRRGWHMRR
jgi:hypothetical protein